jgi:hypothetical protein
MKKLLCEVDLGDIELTRFGSDTGLLGAASLVLELC